MDNAVRGSDHPHSATNQPFLLLVLVIVLLLVIVIVINVRGSRLTEHEHDYDHEHEFWGGAGEATAWITLAGVAFRTAGSRLLHALDHRQPHLSRVPRLL